MSLQLYLGTVAIDGGMTAGSHTLTTAIAGAAVGLYCDVLGAGPDGSTLVTSITAVGSGTITLGYAASITVTWATVTIWKPYTTGRYSISGQVSSLTNQPSMSFAADRCRTSAAPVAGQPVLLLDLALVPSLPSANTDGDIFGGSVNDVLITQIPGNANATYDCNCVSWEQIAARRGTGQPNGITIGDPKDGVFTTAAAGTVFAWIGAILGSDASKVSVVTGPTIAEITFDYTDLGAAFDSICQASNDGSNTYIWRADCRRNFYFELQSTSAAPWNISNSEALVGCTYSHTLEKFANSATVTPQSSTGSGIDNTLVRVYNNTTSIDERAGVEGGTGYHEVIVAAGSANASMDGATLAESIAKTYGVVPATVQYSTYRGGLRAGHLQTIVISDLGCSGTFLIDSVSLSMSNGIPLWAIHAVDGALIGDWRTALANLANNSAGYSSVSGGIDNSFWTDAIVSGHIAPDLAHGFNHQVFITSGTAVIVDNPVFTGGSIATGQNFTLAAYQDATGSRPTPTFGTAYSGTSGHAISTDPLSLSTFYFRFDGTNFALIGFAAAGTAGATVTPPALPLTVTASDHTTERITDINRSVTTPIYVTYTLPGGSGVEWLHVWISDGTTKEDVGTYGIGDVIKFWRYPGQADLTCTVLVVTGKTGAENPPSSAVSSASFTIVKLPTPAASNGITATIGAFTYETTPDGTVYGKIPELTYTDPSGVNLDFFVRVNIRELDATGAVISSQKPYGGTQIKSAGASHVEPPLLITLRAGLGGIQYLFYVANKVSQGAGDFADTTTNTLNNVDWNGGSPADHFDVMFGALPAGALDMTRTKPSTWGAGLYLDASGKPKAAGAGDPLNMLTNPRFEDGTTGWSTYAGAWTIAGVGITGNCASLTATGNTFIYQEFSSRPGKRYTLAGFYETSAFTGSATLSIWWLDASHAQIGAAEATIIPLAAWGYQPGLLISGPAPAGTCFARFFVGGQSLLGAGNVLYWDDVSLAEVVPTGPGITVGSDGGVQAKVGASVSTDGSGNLIVKTDGATIGINGSNQVIIPALGVQTANLAAGSLGDLSKYSSTVRAVTITYGLPSLPNSAYPAGAMIMNTADGKVYRTATGYASSWTTSTSPADLFTGTLASGVVYAGTVAAANVTAGSLYGFTITGSSLVLTKSGVTTIIDSVYDSFLGGFTGVQVEDVSSGGFAAVTPFRFALKSSSGVYNYLANNLLWLGNGTATTFLTGGKLTLNDGTFGAEFTPSKLMIGGLPSSSPGAGSRQFWYDPADGNRVKFAV